MALALAWPAMTFAQDEPRGPRRDGPPPNREGGPGQRPVPPLMAALDANHDGVLDEDEIKNAPEALRKLDKDNDGKIMLEELRPQRPEGAPERRRVQARDDSGPGDTGDRPTRRGQRPPKEQ